MALGFPAFPGMITQELQIPQTVVCSDRLGRGDEDEAPMTLADITKEAVDSAILEYDQLSAASFLAKYGFATAKRYWIELDGKLYPTKAIAGVAHKYRG